MNGGLDRDEVEDLWCRRKKKGQKKGERLGWINADRLQPYANGIEALCKYLTKFKRKKRWSPSQNLKKPVASYNDNNYGKREVQNLSKDLPGRAFWENKYPGWTLVDSDYGVKAEFNKETSQWSIYLKMRRIE
ncbi:hypothetical protein SDC9_174424 [bioreactor metagenome]|uniref:Uncharacterized protein n=1 Tax=bioreactor metagenome TaxID=1076179 RepID=A0A645GJC0_9ZZZZ